MVKTRGPLPSSSLLLIVVVLLVVVLQAALAFVPPSSITSTTTTSARRRGLVECKKDSSSSGKKPVPGAGFGFAKKSKPEFKYAGELRPGELTPKRPVPEGTILPEYALDGVVKTKEPAFPWIIEVKTPAEIEAMRESGRLAREVLDAVGKMVKPGVTTDELDALAHEMCTSRGAYPSPLNYCGYPKSCCTSVNEVICHGIPDSTVLKDGDIINVDITVYYKGYHGDCSETYLVGNVDAKGRELVKVTFDAWQEAINFCQPGRPYKEIGGIIEDYITKRGYTTVREFCGHGVGSVFHTTPSILHFKNSVPAGVMAEGHTFTIEPMICEGSNKHILWPDKWTATTNDGKRSAQFEHTLLITKNGVEALTGKLPDSPKYFWET